MNKEMKSENIKVAPQWGKGKDDVWNEIFAGIEDTCSFEKKRCISLGKYAAAVMIAVVLTGVIAVRFYRVTQIAVRGSHLAVTLPDGSKVNLNAESTLAYNPYWWFVSKSVELKGEAYFEVKSGKRFCVRSNQNEVNVLGTSFNVFSRPERYSVTCLTGKVKVVVSDETVILNPNMQLTYHAGKLTVEEDVDAVQLTGWNLNKFIFVGVPLVDVISEIERQYNISIAADASLDHAYTGSFFKTEKAEDVLDIIGKPFGIKFSIR